MNASHRMPRTRVFSGLLVAISLIAPQWVGAADPIDTIGEAFRASSNGLRSGIGKGKYRHYDLPPGGDWRLRVEANILTQFDGRNFRVEFDFEKDELKNLSSKKMFYDGEKVTVARFTPQIHPTGAGAYIKARNDVGDGLQRGAWGEFPWDAANLARNAAWSPDRLVQILGRQKIEVRETPEGDLIGDFRTADDRIRIHFECPRRFGYNLATKQAFNLWEDAPAQEINLQWKLSPMGLWYVTSLLETVNTRDQNGKPNPRMRGVVMYSSFEPNAQVDPKLFTEESLHMPAGSMVRDTRPGSKIPDRTAR